MVPCIKNEELHITADVFRQKMHVHHPRTKLNLPAKFQLSVFCSFLTYMSSSYRSNRLGLSHWDPYAVRSGGCLELYYCNIIKHGGVVLVGFKPDLWRPTGFLQCFDTVGLVICPVKIVPEMTYYVSSGTLNPTLTL